MKIVLETKDIEKAVLQYVNIKFNCDMNSISWGGYSGPPREAEISFEPSNLPVNLPFTLQEQAA